MGIKIKDLTKKYDSFGTEITALGGVNLTFNDGELVAIIGESGSGKTTLLNQLCGMDVPDNGEIIIDGIHLTKLSSNDLCKMRRSKIGVVYQFYNKGQTLGKRLMKIRVVSNDNRELTINDYIFRSMILNSVLVNILVVVLVMFMNKNYYFYVSFPLQLVQIVLSLITIFMILFRKDGRGLHDMVAHSKVVMEK